MHGDCDLISRRHLRLLLHISFSEVYWIFFQAEDGIRDAQESRVRVVSYSGMTIEAAKQCGAQFLIRGVRSTSDFEYEQSISQINDHLHGPMTVLLFGAQGLLHISSSMVRELLSWNLDVSDYVPSGMPLTFD